MEKEIQKAILKSKILEVCNLYGLKDVPKLDKESVINIMKECLEILKQNDTHSTRIIGQANQPYSGRSERGRRIGVDGV